MNDPRAYQQLGALQAKVEVLEQRTEAMDGKLDTLLARSAKARGGNSMLWKIGTISSAAGALALSVLQWLQGKGTH